jgi:hypothetical protein
VVIDGVDFVVIMDDDAFAALDSPQQQRATPSIHPAWHHHCHILIRDAGLARLARLAQSVQKAQHARSPPCVA